MTTGTIDVTPGTGEEIAFDKGVTLAGGAQGDLQLIKKVLGGDNDYVGYQSGRLVDGTTDEGAAFVEERPDIKEFSATLTIDTSAYAAGDLFGEMQTITNAAKATGGGLRIESLVVTDADAETPMIDFLFFNDSITAGTDNSPFAPSDADLIKFRGGVGVLTADWSVFSANAACAITNIGLIIPALVATSLYVVCVIRDANTFTASTDIAFKIAYTRL